MGSAMPFEDLRKLQNSAFAIPRYTDKQVVEKLDAVAQECGYQSVKSTFTFAFSDDVITLKFSPSTDLNSRLSDEPEFLRIQLRL